MHYYDIALVAVAFVILFEVLMIVATLESPRWLFSKNRDDTATQILKILRGKDAQVQTEIDEIKMGLKCKPSIKHQFICLQVSQCVPPLHLGHLSAVLPAVQWRRCSHLLWSSNLL